MLGFEIRTITNIGSSLNHWTKPPTFRREIRFEVVVVLLDIGREAEAVLRQVDHELGLATSDAT